MDSLIDNSKLRVSGGVEAKKVRINGRGLNGLKISPLMGMPFPLSEVGEQYRTKERYKDKEDGKVGKNGPPFQEFRGASGPEQNYSAE